MTRSSQSKRSAAAVLASGLLVAAVGIVPPPSLAQPPNRHDAQRDHHEAQRDHEHADHSRYEWRRDRYVVARPPAGPVKSLPPGHASMRIGDRHYYEHGGEYYVRQPSGFVLVAPPVGVVVASLPVGALTLHIGGVVYFLAGGIYYRHGPYGYVVVTAPQPVPDTVGSAIQRVIVQAPLLNVRSGPGLEFSVVGRIEQGVSLPVFGSGPGWYYVRLPDGQYGWVMAQYTIPVHVQPAG